MQIWIETTNLSLIEKGVHAGLLHGVVTTPALLKQTPKELIHDLLAAQPGPVVVDVYSDFATHSHLISALSPRIVIRLPAIEEAWDTLHALSESKTPVMAGAIFSPTHALLAARAGAPLISPHLSRMIKTGERPFEQIESIQKIIHNYKFAAAVMVLHPKSLEQVKACAEIGVCGIIVREDLYKELLESHELASFHVEQSLSEWKNSLELFLSND